MRQAGRSPQAAAYHRWYKTKRWQAKRLAQLQACPLCAMCRKAGRIRAANTADHVKPHKGDPVLFWEGDLQSLCGTCHSATKQSEERRGYSTAIGADGWPADPRHPANR